jgi:ATP-dependent DNA helicase RecQ
VIFDDATLRQVAARLPVSEPALLAVRGIGPAKLDSYGSELIAMTEELRPP